MRSTRAGNVDIPRKAVVLACGGFEANAEMRARYLGPGWDLAKVRGTRYNLGAGIKMALDIGALPYGHWSGCHAMGWDRYAPHFGDVNVGDQFQKHSYPWGIMINANGERFVDEGADFRYYTYAKYGARDLNQPGMFAWQVFDYKLIPPAARRIPHQAGDQGAREYARRAAPEDGRRERRCALQEIKEYNAAVQQDKPFNMAIKDGRRTVGLKVDKTNWANTIDEAPFEAYAVTCGVTFSFGGLKITNDAEVEDALGKPIPGLFAAGELVGGIFYHNYPGGTGLTNGSVSARSRAIRRRRIASETGIGDETPGDGDEVTIEPCDGETSRRTTEPCDGDDVTVTSDDRENAPLAPNRGEDGVRGEITGSKRARFRIVSRVFVSRARMASRRTCNALCGARGAAAARRLPA